MEEEVWREEGRCGMKKGGKCEERERTLTVSHSTYCMYCSNLSVGGWDRWRVETVANRYLV